MKKYVGKVERKSEKFGGGIKTTIDFHAVRANDEAEALKDIQGMMNASETLLYICEECNIPAEDLKAFQEN